MQRYKYLLNIKREKKKKINICRNGKKFVILSAEETMSLFRIYDMNRKRKIFLLVSAILMLLSAPAARAQYSALYSADDAPYAEGVELYIQGQWGASDRALKSYKGKSHATQAQFYIAANAFEMRKKNARRLLQSYLKQNPYTPYGSEVHFMLGTMLVEQKQASAERI